MDGMECMEQFVLKGERGCREKGVVEFDSVSDDDRFCVFGQHLVATVVLKSWSQVEALKCMEVPRVVDSGFVVDENTASRRAQGCGIKVVQAKQIMPR